MSDQAYTRRSSYGPTSPTIGARGARTRQQILDAALACFVDKGFHATSVEDIAAAAETSRATLYQYFESKDAIFTELLFENGETLIRITRDIGRLGPDREGYHHLALWIRDWTRNFDRFAPLFVEWTNVVAPNSPLRPQLLDFTNAYAKKVGRLLRTSGQRDGNPEATAILVMALLTRFNYIRYVYAPGLTEREYLDSITVAVQMHLFPETTDELLVTDPLESDPEGDVIAPPPITRMGPLATLPSRESIERADPFAGLSAQATRTAKHLLDSASKVFAANGYEASNIDQVVAEAGLARGTFYRYFSSKLDLITALSYEGSAAMCPLFDELPTVIDDPAALRDWLARYLAIQQRYTGVLRAWTEGFPIDPNLLAPAFDVVVKISDAVAKIFGPPRPYPLKRRAGGMLLAALLEHFPNEGIGTQVEPSDAVIVETEALFIERVFLRR
jgi:AcrR family transcriptional regulator